MPRSTENPLTVKDALQGVRARLRAGGIDSADVEARLLVQRATGLARERQITQPDRLLTPEEGAQLEALVVRRLTREPLAYLLGEREFFGLSFAVSPAVLVPRPETELLIEEALAALPDREARLRLLDLGTGSGCLIVTALTLWQHALGVGVDRSAAAIAVAAANGRRHGVERRLLLVQGDWTDALQGPFDLVLANPPYVAEGEMAGLEPDVRDFEPRSALVAGADGLDDYRRILPALPGLLAPGGLALLELGAGQAEALALLGREQGLEVSFARDLAGVARCARLRRPPRKGNG